MKFSLSIGIVVVITFFIFGCAEQNKQSEVVALTGKTMGTTYMVKYVEQNTNASQLSPQFLQQQVDDLLININQLMSTYIPDSELSLLNKFPANKAYQISPQTKYVLEEALKIHQMSDGLLDITVGPLVNLWGFGPQQRPQVIPREQTLAEIRQYVGIDKLEILDNEIIKSNEKVYIDLSTIAKGYGVDAIAELLESNGLKDYLVEIGGEMRVAGNKAENQDWLVAIEKPVSHQRAVQKVISVGDNAIASSGDYRNYYEEDGRRYSHLIDPSTGYPIQHNLVAVTVVAKKSIHADGLATALMIMGKDKGMEMAEKHDIAALLITKEGDEFVEYQSSAFKQQVKIVQ